MQWREIRTAYPICQRFGPTKEVNIAEASASYDIAAIVLGPLPKAMQNAAEEVRNEFKRRSYAGMSIHGVYWEWTAIDQYRERAFKNISVAILTPTFVQMETEFPQGFSGGGIFSSNHELIGIVTTRTFKPPSVSTHILSGSLH